MEGLSALSRDALTSVAYGPEAIIAVLALAGAGALQLDLVLSRALRGRPDVIVARVPMPLDLDEKPATRPRRIAAAHPLPGEVR